MVKENCVLECNGQWNIPTLKKLLEDVFTKDAHFKGYEVTHDFPKIGKRTMILNARRVYRKDDATGAFWPMALIAIEDVTDLMDIALKLATQTNNSKIKEDPKKRAVAPLVENLDEILTTINLS